MSPDTSPALSLRRATAEDAHLLWEWRNDPDVRRQSFSTERVPWEDHVAWLGRRLRSDSCRLWIAQRDGDAVAQIRFEREGETATISFSVGAAFRGAGIGTALLRLAAPRACTELGVTRVVGDVKLTNPASMLAFERAGFHACETAEPATGGDPYVRYERHCTRDEVS